MIEETEVIMEIKELYNLLSSLYNRDISVDRALKRLKSLPYEDIGVSKIDFHRGIRKGIIEAVFGEGKSSEEIVKIATKMNETGQPILVTRITEEKAQNVLKNVPSLHYNPLAMALHTPIEDLKGHNTSGEEDIRLKVPVFTGGTSDINIAEEAVITLKIHGIEPIRVYDCGIAGLHRLLDNIDIILDAPVIIAIAGMDGALPCLIAGIAPCPVIAVPASIGYGTSFNGITPLLTMLNCCAQGISVVNINNGFGAACSAILICNSIIHHS